MGALPRVATDVRKHRADLIAGLIAARTDPPKFARGATGAVVGEIVVATVDRE